MRRLMCATLLSLAIHGAAGQPHSSPTPQGTTPARIGAQYRFAGIPWGANADVVTTSLQKLGLRLARTDSVGDMIFQGKIIYRDALVIASMTDGGLGRLVVSFVSAPGRALPLYEDIRRDLVSKYGKPAASSEQLPEPYHEGDGREDEALKTGRAHFAATWHQDAPGESLALLIDERPGVLMLYASPDWPAAEARRKKATPKM